MKKTDSEMRLGSGLAEGERLGVGQSSGVKRLGDVRSVGGRRRRRTEFQCEDDGEGEMRAQSVEWEGAEGLGDSEVWTRSDLVSLVALPV